MRNPDRSEMGHSPDLSRNEFPERTLGRISPESRLEVLLDWISAQPGLSVLAPDSRSLTLPAEIAAAARATLTGDVIRPGGLQHYNPRSRLSGAEWSNLLDWHREDAGNGERLLTIDQAQATLRRCLRQAGHADEAPRLYRLGNALAHALSYEVGWLDQGDLSWLMVERLRIHDEGGNDSAFFSALDPAALRGYGNFNGGFYDQGRHLFHALGLDLAHPEVHRLLNSCVVTEIDLRAYLEQIPAGHENDPFLVVRANVLDEGNGLPVECLAPLPPADRGEFGARVIAVVERTGAGPPHHACPGS